MGLIYANIKLSNPVIPDSRPIETNCLVDSGSTYLCITLHIANQLGLKELQQREVFLANGSSLSFPYVGPIKIEFENHICFVGAVAMGDECLLGNIPMVDMDLVIHPKYLKLAVNTESSNFARGYAN